MAVHLHPAYWISVVLYFIFLALFLRYFLWRSYANRHYWHRRPVLSPQKVEELAQRAAGEIPFFSILVPARNEAEVIASTIEHLAGLRYPGEHYEIIVITDAKEEMEAARAERPVVTTQQVVGAKKNELSNRPGAPAIKHVSVPYDFDGRLYGRRRGREVPSTKARALNYGLQFTDPQAKICAFYDAESHPEQEVLLYVAYRYLTVENPARLWQGPVFQVRNFYRLGLITKLASLYQAIGHAWYLPCLMQRLPFVGGTNFLAERQLLDEIGGFDPTALTEDLEIGVRAFLEKGAWPEYIPYYSTEQTPPAFRAFFRQRLRWATGHLQVVDKFRHAPRYPDGPRRLMVRRLWVKGQGEWTLYQTAVLLPFFLAPAIMVESPDLATPPWGLLALLRVGAFIYLGFTYYLFYRFQPYMTRPATKTGWVKRLLAALHLLFLPLGSLFFPLPYTAALLLKALHRQPQSWVKTPRTREVPANSPLAYRSGGIR